MDTQTIFQLRKVLFLKHVLIQFNVSTIKPKSKVATELIGSYVSKLKLFSMLFD